MQSNLSSDSSTDSSSDSSVSNASLIDKMNVAVPNDISLIPKVPIKLSNELTQNDSRMLIFHYYLLTFIINSYDYSDGSILYKKI